VLIHLAPGTKQSTECCREFLEDLRRRGLSDPVLAVTDGAPGFIRAVEECLPASLEAAVPGSQSSEHSGQGAGTQPSRGEGGG